MIYGMQMNRLTAIAALTAVGCATESAPTADRNVAAVTVLLDALDVERTLNLALDPETALQLDRGCQVESEAFVLADGSAPIEQVSRWEGPCKLQDGALLEGTLTLTQTVECR